MKIRTMIMFENVGTWNFVDQYRVQNTLQLHPFYVFDQCGEEGLGEAIIRRILEKYPNVIFKFTVSYGPGKEAGCVNVSRDNIPIGKLRFDYSDVIEHENWLGKKDYYKLQKVIGNV